MTPSTLPSSPTSQCSLVEVNLKSSDVNRREKPRVVRLGPATRHALLPQAPAHKYHIGVESPDCLMEATGLGIYSGPENCSQVSLGRIVLELKINLFFVRCRLGRRCVMKQTHGKLPHNLAADCLLCPF